ncbi:MAG: LysR family transcriptional regulator [Longicatena sp.]
MDIKQLEYFVTVCEKQNFTEASYHCNITQSGLSKQIRKLEEELGYVLIERNTRTFQLSREGKVLLEYANDMLKLHNECILQLQQSSEIRIGSMTVLAPYHFAKIMGDFRSLYPNVNLYMEEDRADVIVERIASYDFVILRSFMVHNPQKYNFIPLFDDSLCAVVSTKHPLAKRKQLRLLDLKEESFVFPTKGSGGHEAFHLACEQAGFTPDIHYEFPQANTILSFVKENMGVTITFQKVADEFMKDGLCKINLVDEIHFPIALIYAKNKQLNRIQKALVEFIKERNLEE